MAIVYPDSRMHAIIFDDNRDVSAIYDISEWVDIWPTTVNPRSEGAVGQMTCSVYDVSPITGDFLPFEPIGGIELVYASYNALGVNLHDYHFTGKLIDTADTGLPEGRGFVWTLEGWERDTNAHVSGITFQSSDPSGANYALDEAERIRILVEDVGVLQGVYDAHTYVQGPYIDYTGAEPKTYPPGDVYSIIFSEAGNRGSLGDVQVRRWHIEAEWADPANVGTIGLIKYIYYYTQESGPMEVVPLTDRDDKLANYASDDFDSDDTDTHLLSSSGHEWTSYVGQHGIANNRGFVSDDEARNATVLDAHIADGEVGITFPVLSAGSRLYYRVTPPVPAADPDEYSGFLVQYQGSNNWNVYQYAAGIATVATTFSAASANGFVLAVKLSATSHIFYANGISVGTLTSAYNQSATKHGWGGSSATEVDNFYVQGVGIQYYDWQRRKDYGALINAIAIATTKTDPSPAEFENLIRASAGVGMFTKTSVAAWTPNAIYSAGDRVRPRRPNGRHMRATNSGQAGAVEPTWSLIEGTAIADSDKVVGDDYARPDTGVLGNTLSGQSYTLYGTGAAFATDGSVGRIVTNDGGTYFAVAESGVGNAMRAHITLTTAATGAMLAFNFSDGNNGWLVKLRATDYALYKREAGSNTFVTAGGSTPANGNVLSAERAGSNITIRVGGVSIITASDAFNSAGTKHGFGGNTSEGAATARFDNLEVHDTARTSIAAWVVDTWDSSATSKQVLTEDGGYALFTVEQRVAVSDDYLRVNNPLTIGKTSDGKDYVILGTGGRAGVLANQGYISQLTEDTYAVVESGLGSSVIVQVTFSQYVTGQRLCFRAVDKDNLYYIEATNTNWKLYKRENAVETLLATYATGAASGNVVKVAATEGTIQFYVAASEASAFTLAGTVSGQTFNLGATLHGWGKKLSGAASRFDNFRVWETYGTKQFGLHHGTFNGDYTTMHYSFRLDGATRQAVVVESNFAHAATTLSSISVGDQFKVEAIKFLPNGQQLPYMALRYYYKRAGESAWGPYIYESGAVPVVTEAVPLRAVGAIYHIGASVTGVQIARYTYSIHTNEASIKKYGWFWHKGLYADDNLDTYTKRGEKAGDIFARYGEPLVVFEGMYELEYPQVSYRHGRRVLINNEDLGWIDVQQYLVELSATKGEVQNPRITEVQFRLGASPWEYGDDDPLGQLLRAQDDDNTGPLPPLGLERTTAARDGISTVSQSWQWARPTHDEHWMEVEVVCLTIGGQSFTVRWVAGVMAGTLQRLFPATLYKMRARYIDRNNNPGDWTDYIEYTTIDIPPPGIPENVAVASNVWDAGQERAVVVISWEQPTGSTTYSEFDVQVTIGGENSMMRVRNALQLTLVLIPLLLVQIQVRSVDAFGYPGNLAPEPALELTTAGPIFHEALANPGFEAIKSDRNPLNPANWLLDTTGTGSALRNAFFSRKGEAALLLSCQASGTAGATSDLVAIDGDATYTLGVYVYAAGTASDNLSAYIATYDADFVQTNPQRGAGELTVNTLGDWVYIKQAISVDADDRYAEVILRNNGNTSNVVLHLDDIYFVRKFDDGDVKPASLTEASIVSATSAVKGVVRFAPNGGTDPLEAVQANDDRLNDGGDTLPPSPATGQKFFYTGAGKNVWVHYDGTRWLGPLQEYHHSPAGPASLTTAQNLAVWTPSEVAAYHFERLTWRFVTRGTHNAFNNWKWRWQTFDWGLGGGATDDKSTAAYATNTVCEEVLTSFTNNDALWTSGNAYYAQMSLVVGAGAPTQIDFYGVTLQYRRIYT